MQTLIDNSTITAALRALGYIQINNRELFDLDVTALRVLIDAILMSDEVHILDNYKAEYSSERKAILAHDSIKFRTVPDKLDAIMSKNANAHVVNWHMSQHLGLEFKEIFHDLLLLFGHAWRNSESFLVLKAFGVDNKYHSILTKAMIEYAYTMDDKKLKEKLSPKAYNRETSKVAQALSWSAIRTVYYREAAKYYGLEYLSHPLRNTFNAKCILFDNHPNTRKTKLHSAKCGRQEYWERTQYYRDIHAFFRLFWQDCNTKDDNIFGVETFDIDMPPFFAYVLQASSDGQKSILETAFRLRDEPNIMQLRSELNKIYKNNNEEGNLQELRNFAAELRMLKDYMQRYLGYERERVAISAKLISYNLTVPRFMLKPLYPTKPHLAIIRDVILELSSVSSMGRKIDYIWSRRNS